ncbi:MAG: hypothetical protein ACOZQL_12010 [Myxococcota bacterium]
MRRVLSAVVLVLFSLGGLFAVHLLSVARLKTRLAEERAALARLEVKHTLSRPIHDNGFQCLKLLLDVTRPDAASAFETAAPEETQGDALRSQVAGAAAWVQGVRECASSARVTFVDGLSPDQPDARARGLLRTVIPRLFHFTAAELRLLLADQQPGLALERCTASLSLAVDLSQLGADGVEVTRGGLEALAPGCARALAAAKPEERAEIAKAWSAIPTRMVTAPQLVARERLAGTVRWFGAAADLPGAPGPQGFVPRLRHARAALDFDAAMRNAQTEPTRADALERVKAALPADAGTFDLARALGRREEASELLTVLLAVALDDKSERPRAVRTDAQVTWTPASGAPVVLPLR